MPQVIIVSNRLPMSVKKEKGKLVYSASLGGLATGLASFVGKGKDNLWIGWPGIASEELTSRDKQDITNELSIQGYVPVFLSRNQIDNFYNGYSNSILWPDFHGLPQRKINEYTIKRWFQAYQSVNRKFCDAVSSHLQDKSQVWVHDYQLLLLPKMLRKEKQDVRLGFFLHIPFPGPRAFTKNSVHKELLEGILGADLIGFHTDSYVSNFLKSTGRLKAVAIHGNTIIAGGRTIRAGVFPMGIDFEKFDEANKSKDVKRIVKQYKKRYKGLKIIASVDRLDPSKGLTERLKAYEKFLEKNPKYKKKVVFVMVAAPSRTDIEEYKNLSKQLDKLSAGINEKLGTKKWKPLEYINVPLPFENVTALFSIADVAFIAPLKDGMNLTAKEFVASNKHGVLILSETAGAAEELRAALLVDPKKPDTLVDALEKALVMQRLELRKRLFSMRKHLSTHTVEHWAHSFVDALQHPIPGTSHLTRSLNGTRRNNLVRDYKSSKKRLLLLDYDGSLVPFKEDFRDSDPSPDLMELLEKLSNDKKNEVVLISGRKSADLDKWFGNLDVSLVAEHGAAIKGKGSYWISLEEDDIEWKSYIQPSLEKYAALTPGAKVEIKPHSLVWHYRAASPYHAQKYIVIIKRALKPFLKRYGLELLQGNKVIEIRKQGVNKGTAAMRWISGWDDFILAIGDDATDEDTFAVLPPQDYSIKVGRGITKARYRLQSSKEVMKLLKALA